MLLQATRGGKRPELLAELEGPSAPACLEYLRGWLFELHGRSGVGMSGVAPLSYGTIADWTRLTGAIVRPEEVRALIRLDAVLLHPEPREP